MCSRYNIIVKIERVDANRTCPISGKHVRDSGTRLKNPEAVVESNIMKLKIGSILKSLMDKQGWTLKELSKVSKVPKSTLGEWCNGRIPQDPLQAKKVAEALGVSFHHLYFGEEDSQEPIQKILKEDVFQGTFEITVKKVKI